ncbi:thioredoxin family protein [Flavobacterium sp. RS13.1]|uniref:thioredoxin family protein n=1 Tax=Flavobacterium sp. RS13.1 TaxID=3400345 RepID=UPI003AAC81DF
MSRKLLIPLFFLIGISMKSQGLEWKTNITDAIILSNEVKKPILIFFTATDAPEDLQNEVFKTEDFEKWSRKNVVLLKLDFSETDESTEERDQNIKLKKAFGVQNLPEVYLAKAFVRNDERAFNILGKLPYNFGGVEGWINDSNLVLNRQ